MADLSVAVEINAQDHLSAAAEHGTRSLQQLDRAADRTGGALRGLADHAAGAASGIQNLAGRIVSLATVVTIAHAIENAFRRLFDTIGGGVIGMNANLETATLQFTGLMGSADLAKEHVASLFELGKESPFQTAAFIEGSRLLETFGGAALNTRENLVRFADAAAQTNNRVEEVSFWVGRMYAALQGGRPFGESIQRLTEMAIVSPKVAAALADISEKGGDGAEAWRLLTADMDRFNGASAALAGTWQGLTSTFQEAFQTLLAGAGKPFFDAMKSGLSDLNELLGSDAAQQFSADLAKRFTEVLTNLGTMKDEWLQQIAVMRSEDAGLSWLDAGLKATANLIGTDIGPQSKKEFEELTTSIGGAGSAMGSFAKFTSDAIGPTSRLADAASILAQIMRQIPGMAGFEMTPIGRLLEDRRKIAEAAIEALNLERKQLGPVLQPGRSVNEEELFGAGGDEGLFGQGPHRGPPAPRPGRETTPPAFPVAGRAGGATGRTAGAGGREAAETAIEGFIAGLQGGEANMEAAANRLGAKLGTALNTAVASNSKSAGQSVSTALEDVITALRESGQEDWRETGDALAGALHDALVARTPETVQAAQDMIRDLSRTIDEAQFWQKWAKAGEDAATKVNIAIQTTAEKIASTTIAAANAIKDVWASLRIDNELERARKNVDAIIASVQEAHRLRDEQIGRQRQDEDVATNRLRQDADRAEAHERALAAIRRRGGPTTGVDLRAENARFAQETADLERQRARENADRARDRTRQGEDVSRGQGARNEVERRRIEEERARGLTPEQQRERAAFERATAIRDAMFNDFSKFNSELAEIMRRETEILKGVGEKLGKDFPTLFTGAQLPGDGQGNGRSEHTLNINNSGLVVDMQTFIDSTLEAEAETEARAVATQGA